MNNIDIVEAALCFGWIDSTLKKLPDGRLAQRLSPRRKGSHWTELNKQRCRDLERQGLMTDFGMKELHESNLEGMGIDNPCKYLTCRDFLRRVPGRTRTVDIQNHNLTL